MVVNGMYGLGDNIFQRAVLREVKEHVYLKTCWPQLYADLLHIHPVKPVTHLRTQVKNLERQNNAIWHMAPSLPPVKMSYSSIDLKRASIIQILSKIVSIQPRVFDIPKFTGKNIDKRYAVIRPTTVRSEWYNRARGPEDGYICKAAELLRAHGFFVVSIADIAEKEWCEKIPESDLAYNHGELIFEELMSIIQGASVVVGGVGWIVPACIAAGIPLITILGGQGGHNAPEKITDKPMKLDKARFIRPDNYCMCRDNRHNCDKTITDFDKKFTDKLEAVCEQ